MQKETYDFLVKMRVPMLTFGGDLMGDAIELVMDDLKVSQFISLAEIEESLADRYCCSVRSTDRRLRRALEMAEYRSGEFPNRELEVLRVEYHIEAWTVKKFLYAAARRLMKDE